MSHSERSSNKRHVMITGCAGFVGRSVARETVARGESMIGLYHQKLPESLDKMMPLCADLRSPETLLAPLRSVDTVIHLAWSGGVLGSLVNQDRSGNAADISSELIKASQNVQMTTHLVRAMERQGVKRIVFLSWIGADDQADKLVLREKYWAENVILNSRIPEKYIIRSGAVIDLEDKASEFAQATFRLTKFPLFTPMPKSITDVVFSSRKELALKIVDKALEKAGQGSDRALIDEITSMAPVSSQNAIINLSSKWWGQNKWALGGFLGRWCFKALDSEFGRLQTHKAKVEDFMELSRGSRLICNRIWG